MRSFGVASRENYDSEAFYERGLYEGLKREDNAILSENPVPPDALDSVTCQDSRRMVSLPDRSIHLVVTSPPYNVGKDYDADLPLKTYLELLEEVFNECHRVLVTGGRACINVANLGRRPYIPLHCHLMEKLEKIGFLMRGEIIWNKAASAGSSTAWGSWKSAANPTLRDVHEYILVFSKGSYGRQRSGKSDTITEAEFLELTKSIWSFRAESAKRVNHPAPFPVELPYRLMQLYTFEGDVVLDPFGGSGSTAIAAKKAGRHFVLYDTSEEYVRAARLRIREYDEVGQDDGRRRKRVNTEKMRAR